MRLFFWSACALGLVLASAGCGDSVGGGDGFDSSPRPLADLAAAARHDASASFHDASASNDPAQPLPDVALPAVFDSLRPPGDSGTSSDDASLADAAAPTDAAAPPDASLPQDSVPPPDLAAPPPPPDLMQTQHDLSPPVDLAVKSTPDLPPPPDLAPRPPDLARSPADLTSPFLPPGGSDDPMWHAPASSIAVALLPGSPGHILDVGGDRGGGIWAVTRATLYYWTPGGARYAYNQASAGLARGDAAHAFASVAGGLSGHAYVGNLGAIGDHLVVNPSTGGVMQVENMAVPFSNSPEYPEHLKRVTAGLRMVVDVDGTFAGTAYNGGLHGATAWHGVDGDCGCLQFEEHQHYIPESGCDSTVPQSGCWGGDTAGLAISPTGDLWVGDEHFVALLPQRSLGMNTDFLIPFSFGIDVFPGVNDEVKALAADAAGGLWVASFGEGLAYLAPHTLQPSYYDRARELPQNRLTAVAVDTDGSVWVGTIYGGIARKKGSGWTYYTGGSGLPSDAISSIFVDRFSSPRRVIIGTDNGVGVYTGP